MSTQAVVLAAGKGKRMKSKLYKVLHPVCGKPMVGHVVDALEQMNTDQIAVIVGHGAESVKEYLGSRVEYALQEEQLGTGHAVKQAVSILGDCRGTTIVICGDTPLVTAETLSELVRSHEEGRAAVTMLTSQMEDPTGYGRVIRAENGSIDRIVEQKDCTPDEAKVQEINAGVYCFDNLTLFESLAKLTNHNAQHEYYLTEVIEILRKQGDSVGGYMTTDAAETMGVNDRVALARVEELMRARINRLHMERGVTLMNAQNTYIDSNVTIGTDTVLLPGVVIRGNTEIGEDCVIGPNTDITDSSIGDRVTVKHSVLLGAAVGHDTTIGPFAYLRPGARLHEHVKIGDFVEVKNAEIGDGSKISHLSYVGDAVVGKDVNIGCGAITVNYDGYNKNKTEIGDQAFIGSNVNLIAPVSIARGGYVVAGSTITNDVGENDLAIARERQTNKSGYAERLRNRMKARKASQEPPQ